MSFRIKFREFLGGFEFRSTGKWFFLSSLIGLVVGVAAILFQLLSQVVMHYSLSELGGYVGAEANNEYSYFETGTGIVSPMIIITIMTVGGLLAGILIHTFAPETAGAGTDAVVAAFHNNKGKINKRVPVVKTLAASITLGTGGSAGREGPIAQIGGGIGSNLADLLHLSERDRRIMLAAGMAAGIGAIFRAPLAAALFAGEILYKDGDLESDVIVPAAIASIVSYSVYCLALPASMWFAPLFGPIGGTITSPFELIPFGLMSLVLVLTGIVYIRCAEVTRRFFQNLRVPAYYRPAIGAFLAGSFAFVVYLVVNQDDKVLGILSVGYNSLQDAFNPQTTLSIRLLLVIAFAKILTTSLTIGSGGAGGFFGPSMVIGGCLGAAFGQIVQQLIPGTAAPQVYALVGMAGFFAGIAHAPFSTIVMVSEMTGDYSLLLPTMWVATLCSLLCRRWTLYRNQVPSRLESPAHRGDFIVDLLEGIRVKDVFNPDRKLTYVPEWMSLDEIVHMLARTHQQYYPVVDRENRLVGMFSADDVREWLYDESIWKLAVARDVMVTNLVSVTPEEDLNSAMQKFTSLNLDELPVLDPDDPARLLGMLRRKETIAFYNRRLMEHKQDV